MKDKMRVWWTNLVRKYNRLWQFGKDYARKCRLVYKRMYSI